MSESKILRVVCLLAAVALAIVCWKMTNPKPPCPMCSPDSAELTKLCEGDTLLATRLQARLVPAIEIGQDHGINGLKTLDIFGDDAVFLYKKNPEAFSELKNVCQLEGSLFAASTGTWKQALVQWATAGTLSTYLKKTKFLTDEDKEILADIPEALPLLIAKETPTANKMLKRYGHRAWNLLQSVDLTDPESIERVAKCLDTHGTSMFRLNEQFGPAIAWMLIPPKQDIDSILPDLFRDSISELGEECASALFLTNYDDILKLIYDENCAPDNIRSAITFIASHSEDEVRYWAADSSYSIRLIMETRGGRQIGQQVFTNCGSMAAELLYQPGGLGVVSIAANETERGEKSRERLAALLVLRDEGWVGLNVLWEYKTTQLLQKLLQREDLVENTDDPLISRIVRKLSRSITVHEDLDIILKKPREQLLGDQYPESPIENFAVWIPGYAAIKVAGQLMKGHHVSNLEAAFAVVDGAVAAFGVGSIVAQAVKTTGKQAVKKSIQKVGQELAKDALEEAGKTIVSRIPGATVASLQTLAKNSTKLEVTHLARAAAATAKKVGIRSWGTLDRRIIMRGDRKVIVDLLRKEVRDEAGTQLIQETGFNALFAVGPLMLERVIPSLQVGN